MKRLFPILFLVFFAVGCGGTLKNSWLNFHAYYNTYYNAKKDFHAGLKKVQNQSYTIDPGQPVRIHHAPVMAGKSDFDEAIDKGAKVLRRFPNSKWVDETLLLIGKSYYYEQEFYPALQKFEELRKAGASTKMDQLAIIWKGRTMLDLKQYSQGASYLETELEDYPDDWSIPRKGEIEALAGEHNVMLENWQQAADFLSKAADHIENKKLLGRTFFLYGQVLERLQQYPRAYFAFSQVKDNFPGFEYTFWAGVKQADVSRKQGNLDLAISIYDKLRKDDKNFQRRDMLTYEIARTLEMKGASKEAEQSYKGLLYQKNGIQSRSLKSDIYYRLGKINSDVYNNYQLAAAYFDSASSMRDTNSPSASEDTQSAQKLAKAFNRYTSLRKDVQHADSLLWLSSLKPSELDSVINRIRDRKRRELLAQKKENSRQTLVNKNFEEQDQSTKSNIYGFLNYRSAQLVQRAKEEFRIIWGDRPLVDNWRRIEAIQQADVTEAPSGNETVNKTADNDEVLAQRLDLNLAEIPKTEAEKDKLLKKKINAQYQLGSLFFLNLSSPDSARHYFYDVVHSGADEDLRARAMYSLYELFRTSGNQDSLNYWEKQILEQYPRSKYARRIGNTLGVSNYQDEKDDSSKTIVDRYQQLNTSRDPHKAAKLRKLALDNRDKEAAPYIYYQAIRWYMRQARTEEDIADSLQKQQYDFMPDSVQDSTPRDSLSGFYFSSSYWDSVRTALQEFDTTFTNARQRTEVQKFIKILGKPKSNNSEKLPSCSDFNTQLRVSPDMESFLSFVAYPTDAQKASLSGQLVYSFIITPDGQWESYKLVSNKTSSGIEDALEKAFKDHLHFKPLEIKKPPKKLRCKLSFPIGN